MKLNFGKHLIAIVFMFNVVNTIFAQVNNTNVLNQAGLIQNTSQLYPDTQLLPQSRLHILSDRGYIRGKYQFTINGVAFTLKPGHCMEYTASGDSVKVEITNKNMYKKQYPINLYTAAKDDLHLFITWRQEVPKSIIVHKAVKEICKECYLKLAKSCKN